MAHRPFTRAQALQNRRFLAALAETGNARAAARALGVHRATYTKRRAACPAFAARWDAMLAYADAHLKNPPRNGESRVGLPPAIQGRSGGGTDPALDQPKPQATAGGGVAPSRSSRSQSRDARARRGDPILVRLKSGRCQLRKAPPGRMTKAAEQAFLRALAATCNVRLAAAAAGFTHSAFYIRAKKDPGFAREWRLARAEGHMRVEAALLAGFMPESHEDDAWRHNDPLPIPAMTPGMAIQLLAMHRKRVDHGDLPDPMRRRPGESHEAVSMRLSLLYEARLERDREAYRVAAAARNERRSAEAAAEDGEGIAPLPALDQVTGWSGADPAKQVHNPDLAMFGGWRLKDWEKQKRRR